MARAVLNTEDFKSTRKIRFISRVRRQTLPERIGRWLLTLAYRRRTT